MTDTPIQSVTKFQTDAMIFDNFLTDDANTEVDFSPAQDGSDLRPSLEMILANLGLHPAVKGWVDAAQTGVLPAHTYNNGAGGVGATMTADANGAFPAASIDGVAPVVAMRVWISGLWFGAQSGIYVVTQVGDAGTPWILTRDTDADSAAELGFLFAFVTGGATQEGLMYLIATSAAALVVGTTGLTTLVAPLPPNVAVETARAETAEAAIENGLRSCEIIQSADFTLDGTADFWPVDTSGAAVTVTVPAGAGFANQEWTIKKTTAANTITLQFQAGELLDGANTFVLTNHWAAVTFRNKRGSTTWYVKSLYLT
jgi:hypothetical protein